MPSEFLMPSLGADMDEGTVIEWLVKPGDRVERGDVVAIVDTEKAEVEIEIFEAGVIDRIVVEPGATVAVGTVLALLSRADGVEAKVPAATDAARDETKDPAMATTDAARDEAKDPAMATTPVGPSGGDQRVHASPLARRRAAELSMELASVVGTGPDGAVRVADVERSAGRSEEPPARQVSPPNQSATSATRESPSALGRPATEKTRDAMRRAIARTMEKSKREIPHYYLETRIDLSRGFEWLEAHNHTVDISRRLLPISLFLAAVARAANATPGLNGHWVDGRLREAEGVHIGFAVWLRDGGLIAPVIRDAERASVAELMARVKDLATRTRTGRLRSSEVSGATITVTSLGDRGVEKVQAIIHPPQVAIVGFGRPHEAAWAEDGMLAARRVVDVTLAGDHRASDGQGGARFLRSVTLGLTEPESL